MSTAAEERKLTAHQGLSPAEVEASRQEHGANVLTPPERDPWWKLFLEKFDDPVIRILIIAAVVAIGVGVAEGGGHYAEGLGIVVAIFLATTLAFVNEYKAAREFELLNQVTDEQPVKVIRGGAYQTAPRKDIVVGDLVLLEVGEEVPADGELLEAVSLQVDQSRLTGESVPVTKRTGPVEESEGEGETYSANRILRGTMVADGYGLARISAVGDHTEIGQTARAAAEVTGEQTPLYGQLERLSKLIGVVGFSVAAGTFAALVVRGAVVQGPTGFTLTSEQWLFAAVALLGAAVALVRVWLPVFYDAFELAGKELERPQWLENDSLVGWAMTLLAGAAVFVVGLIVLGMTTETISLASPGTWLSSAAASAFLTYFMIAVTLIVVAVPEGLAMSVTLSLAYSMRKMTATNNLVRRMHACETIGAATVICSDKTGTLTLNQMQVAEANFPCLPGETISGAPESREERLVIEAMAANSTANLSRKPGEPTQPLGNPTEGALLLWLEERGINYERPRGDFSIEHEWTFNTERKFMATHGRSAALREPVLHVKGAPEIVLDRCSQLLGPGGKAEPLSQERRDRIRQDLLKQQSRAMRTLAFAYRPAVNGALSGDQPDIDEAARDLMWLGYVAIADPVRVEVPSAIDECRKAGVKVKVVTGDNIQTGTEIARQIHLWNEGEPDTHRLTGPEFAGLSDEQASDVIREMKVLARARPTDKMRLVRLLRDQGEVVAVTGDGVNDAPALNHAHVGLAMGRTGTSVAKEASDIILLDDSFRSIVTAILWGRSLYQNIQRFVLFQLTINVAALTIAFLGPFIGVELPLTVMQMLWVNLIMDTFAALALATEPPHEEVMERPPRDPKAFIITREMAIGILGTGAAFVAVMLGLLYWLRANVGDIPPKEASLGGTIFFCVFVLLQFWNLFNARTLGWGGSAFSGLLENKWFLSIAAAILLGQILLTQYAGAFLRTVPLDATTWLVIIASTSLVLWIGEAWRFIRRQSQPQEAPRREASAAASSAA